MLWPSIVSSWLRTVQHPCRDEARPRLVPSDTAQLCQVQTPGSLGASQWTQRTVHLGITSTTRQLWCSCDVMDNCRDAQRGRHRYRPSTQRRRRKGGRHAESLSKHQCCMAVQSLGPCNDTGSNHYSDFTVRAVHIVPRSCAGFCVVERTYSRRSWICQGAYECHAV